MIAEAGVNHNGSEELALQLVEAAAKVGADAVKFQTFTAEQVVAPGTATASYQKTNTGNADQYEMLKQLELPVAAYAKLSTRARELGIEFMSTPFDLDSADMLVRMGMKRIKIPSGELTNLPFLESLARINLPMIVSTGMGTLDEVGEAITAMQSARKASGSRPLEGDLTLLHCTSNYPAAEADVNLLAMRTMRSAYGFPVGYSDHTAGTLASVAAVAAGAVMVEKHFTLDRGLPGPDHRASLEPEEFVAMVAQIRSVESMLGSGDKKPCAAELPIRDLVRRSLTTKRAIAAGAAIAAEDIVFLRPGTGIPPRDLPRLIGMKAVRDLPAGTTLRWTDVKP
ncbi:MAG TPA: N-acetylneuraminate synthase [Burkholderiales bacterium]|nr:N-acetylneuraminate synthase [Burkholderiales bacterium]